MTLVACIGGGQLGRMLALAGLPLGLSLPLPRPVAGRAARGEVGELVVGAYDDPDALDRLADGADVVTYEFENVPSRRRARVGAVPAAARARARPGPARREGALPRGSGSRPRASARSTETGLPGARQVAPARLRRQGPAPRRRAGAARRTTSSPRSSSPFDRELSIVAVRGRDGETRFWPLAENVHRDGILRGLARARRGRAAGRGGGASRRRLLDELDYVGVLARRAVRRRRPAARERVRAARPQHRPLDDRRRRDEPVREPPARDPRPAARLDGGAAHDA